MINKYHVRLENIVESSGYAIGPVDALSFNRCSVDKLSVGWDCILPILLTTDILIKACNFYKVNYLEYRHREVEQLFIKVHLQDCFHVYIQCPYQLEAPIVQVKTLHDLQNIWMDIRRSPLHIDLDKLQKMFENASPNSHN